MCEERPEEGLHRSHKMLHHILSLEGQGSPFQPRLGLRGVLTSGKTWKLPELSTGLIIYLFLTSGFILIMTWDFGISCMLDLAGALPWDLTVHIYLKSK